MKKRVGLITFHFPYNCGAVLQCWASQTVMERNGCEVKVINYVPWYHRNRYTPFKNPFQFAMQRMRKSEKIKLIAWCSGFARAVYSWRLFSKHMPREKKFYGFINKNLHLTRMYRSIDALRKDPPKADAYVCGSDQLWNVHLTEGFDEAYFLRFGGDDVRRISYAVGADFTEAKNPEAELPELLSRMDAISLRERKSWAAVEKATGGRLPMHESIDPTLLLTREDYESIEEKPENVPERFVLTYVMPNESAHKVFNAARKMGEKLGIAVIDVNGNPLGINKRIEDNRICSPGEFLWYIRHAEYVFTNSFHGTVFSAIYGKQFMVMPHSKTGNRTTELLAKLGLSQRVAKTGDLAFAHADDPIDYEAAQERIGALRKDSLDYLMKNIGF